MSETPSHLVCRLAPIFALSEAEIGAIESLQRPPRHVPAGVELINEGDSRRRCFILLNGWLACYKLLEDGSRQIINFPLPGDLIGLRSFLLEVPDQSVATLTDVQIGEFPAELMANMLDRQPRIAAAILWMMSREEAIVAQHLVNVGRRDAAQRVSHLLLELAERIAEIQPGKKGEFACPLTQLDLADALGLTAIHVNRVLRMLRERNLVTFARRRIIIHDLHGLETLAGFDRRYLQPRRHLPA